MNLIFSNEKGKIFEKITQNPPKTPKLKSRLTGSEIGNQLTGFRLIVASPRYNINQYS
jgi:hypothetical protein